MIRYFNEIEITLYYAIIGNLKTYKNSLQVQQGLPLCYTCFSSCGHGHLLIFSENWYPYADKWMCTPSTKINSEMDQTFKCKTWSNKMPRKALEHSSWQWFLGYDTEITGNKGKHRQVGLCKTKSLLHSMGNDQQNEKATYKLGENNCKLCIW